MQQVPNTHSRGEQDSVVGSDSPAQVRLAKRPNAQNREQSAGRDWRGPDRGSPVRRFYRGGQRLHERALRSNTTENLKWLLRHHSRRSTDPIQRGPYVSSNKNGHISKSSRNSRDRVVRPVPLEVRQGR